MAGISKNDIKKHIRDNTYAGNTRIPRLHNNLDIELALQEKILNNIRYGNSLGFN